MTIRQRNGRHQAIVVRKQSGVVVFQEARTFDTLAQAKDWRERLLRKLKTDGIKARKLARTTLGELIEDYRKAQNEARPLRRQMEHELDQLHSLVGAWRLDQITPEKVADFARRRRQDGAGPTTVLHNLSTLRAILGAAKPMFGVDVSGEPVAQAINALGRSGHVAKSRQREVRVPDELLDRFIAEFQRISTHPSTSIDMVTVTRLAVALPRRLGELCDMRWEDYRGKTVVLRDTKHPVRPRTETVPVPPKARAIIDALPRLDERILPYKTESVSAAWQRAAERLRVHDVHFHDLRHEGICRLFEMGLQIQEVALISGHTSWATLRRYTHLKPEDVLEKMK